MCGILGSLVKKSEVNDKFKISLAMLSHRGPEGIGIKSFNVNSEYLLTLGHARLSIIDLTTAGLQPMSSLDNRYEIVFNGEIYNYLELKKELLKLGFQFNTNTDTEVLINSWSAWGVESFKRFK
jgi:asparagine synthase (glutamine-hydrolysing)